MSALPGPAAAPAGVLGFPCPVIAISMRPQFWQRLRTQLAEAGQREPILCEATDGHGIDVPAWVAEGRYQPPAEAGTRPLTRGELGCSDSHRRVWSYVVEAGLPGALVLEDDADVPADLLHWVNAAWRHRDRWHLLYLGHTAWAQALPIDGVPEFQIPLIAHAWNVTHAYLVTQDGARRLLKDALPVRAPVDVYVARLTVAGLLAWQSARPIVTTHQDTFSSTQGIA